MKILLVIHEYLKADSGSAGSTLHLGEYYKGFGHDVFYFSFDNLPTWMPMSLKDFFFPEYTAFKIFKIIKDYNVDIIDCSTGDLWVWGKLVHFHKKNYILVTRSHGLDHLEHVDLLEDARHGIINLSWKYFLYRGSIRLWEVTESLRCADLNFMLNRYEATYINQYLGINPENTYVFPNGIPERFLNLPFEPTPIHSNSVLRIAQIGSYIQRKGISYSIPALNHILKRYTNVEVSLIGTGEVQSLESIEADFDASVLDRVKIIPHYEHKTLPELLKNHHIKLFPTLSEGFGKALIEAMACGLAPITTPTTGPIDIVHDGHDAIVVPTRDIQAIEVALERLICERQYLNLLRVNAYATAQKYSWRRIAQDRLSAYESALFQKNSDR